MLSQTNTIGSSSAATAIESFAVSTKSLALDGAGDYATFSSTTFAITGAGTDLSIVFWAKRTDNNDIALVLGNSAAFATKRLNFGADGTTLEMEGDTNGQSASGAVTADTDWHHYAITIEGKDGGTESTVAMYDDGAAVSTTNSNLGASAAGFTIDQMGSTGDGSANTHEFKGLLYQVAIYTAVLEAEEVAAIYNSGNTIALQANEGKYFRSLSLLHLWRFATTADSVSSLNLTYEGDAATSSTIPTS